MSFLRMTLEIPAVLAVGTSEGLEPLPMPLEASPLREEAYESVIYNERKNGQEDKQ